MEENLLSSWLFGPNLGLNIGGNPKVVKEELPPNIADRTMSSRAKRSDLTRSVIPSEVRNLRMLRDNHEIATTSSMSLDYFVGSPRTRWVLAMTEEAFFYQFWVPGVQASLTKTSKKVERAVSPREKQKGVKTPQFSHSHPAITEAGRAHNPIII